MLKYSTCKVVISVYFIFAVKPATSVVALMWFCSGTCKFKEWWNFKSLMAEKWFLLVEGLLVCCTDHTHCQQCGVLQNVNAVQRFISCASVNCNCYMSTKAGFLQLVLHYFLIHGLSVTVLVWTSMCCCFLWFHFVLADAGNVSAPCKPKSRFMVVALFKPVSSLAVMCYCG